MRPLDTPQALFNRILEDIRYNLGELIVANLLWFGFSLLIITLPPAFAALHYVANKMSHDEATSWRTFFSGMRLYFWKSWRYMLLNIMVIGLLLLNAILLDQFNIQLRSIFLGFYLVILLLWLLLQIFAFPLIIELEKPQLMAAYRGSFALYFGNPLVALPLTLLIALIIAVSIYAWPAWTVISAGLIAYFANIVTVFLLQRTKDV